ncbi:MAG: flagellar basal body rod protein FlgC [Alphaproteobacteria bacterium]|nr:flagellar basal body rod protein FlgC [Alphaproteobacteria bacterium]
MDLYNSLYIGASGMKSQSDRLRTVSENLANADSTSNVPGGEPYRRKVLTFKNYFDRELGVEKVRVHKRGFDTSAFRKAYEPGHPAADNEGYVLYPNVNTMIEMVDMKEAQSSYEANLQSVSTAKNMLMQTINLLR